MSAVGFLQQMIIKSPEAYWENLESLVPGFLIMPLCKLPSMASMKKKQAVYLYSSQQQN